MGQLSALWRNLCKDLLGCGIDTTAESKVTVNPASNLGTMVARNQFASTSNEKTG
jgi:hypothetical protein